MTKEYVIESAKESYSESYEVSEKTVRISDITTIWFDDDGKLVYFRLVTEQTRWANSLAALVFGTRLTLAHINIPSRHRLLSAILFHILFFSDTHGSGLRRNTLYPSPTIEPQRTPDPIPISGFHSSQN